MSKFHVGDVVKAKSSHSNYIWKKGVVVETMDRFCLVKIGNITQSFFWDDWLELIYREEKLTWQQDGF